MHSVSEQQSISRYNKVKNETLERFKGRNYWNRFKATQKH